MQQQREREKQSNKQYRVVGKTTILHMDKGGGTPDFKWQGCLNGGKNQNPKKSLGLQTKPQKIPGPKFNPPKNPMPNFWAIKISRKHWMI